MWDELRKQLGAEFLYGPGHWFCVRHELAMRSDGYSFSEKHGGSGRRVVLATAHGPNATLFARSASRPSPFSHDAHSHETVSERCKIDVQGWINLRIPVSVDADELNEDTYSCEEPPTTTLKDELRRLVQP